MKTTALAFCFISSLIFFSTQLYSQDFSPMPNEVAEDATSKEAINASKDGVVSSTKDGVAIGGYDPVAFFDQNEAVVGESQYSCNHKGKTWHFSSEENRDKFLESPENFTPQFGGYCAHSLSQGGLVEANPEAFLVRDDTLYFYAKDSLRDKEENRSDVDFSNLIDKRKKNWSEYTVGF